MEHLDNYGNKLSLLGCDRRPGKKMKRFKGQLPLIIIVSCFFVLYSVVVILAVIKGL